MAESNQKRPTRATSDGPQRIKVGVMPLFSTWIYQCEDGPRHLNQRTSAIKWFFNMNPLIKLDGYYLLSDWLDAPNLRKKAFGYVGDQIKRLGGAASGCFAQITPRERWIYLIYALLAGTYSYWLLGKIVLWFGGFMVTRYQGWGFVLFATTLGFLFRQPIRKSLLPITS